MSRTNTLTRLLMVSILVAVPCFGTETEGTPTNEGLKLSATGSLDSAKSLDRLADAIIEIESGWNAITESRSGARGLMQIKRGTWESVSLSLFSDPPSFDQAFDPDLNRTVGSAYLIELQQFLRLHRTRWRADELSLLLAAYTAGPTRVREAGFDLAQLPESTRSYVMRVTAILDSES